MAVAVVVLCGPVKKLIELRTDPSSSSSQLTDKKLKTWYREKRDIVSPVHVYTAHDATGDGPALLTASTLLYLLFPQRQNCIANVQYTSPGIVPELPLYLHINKLQV